MTTGDARGAVLRQEGGRDACAEGRGSSGSGCNGLGVLRPAQRCPFALPEDVIYLLKRSGHSQRPRV